MQPDNTRERAGRPPHDAAALVVRLGLRFGVGAGMVCAAWLVFLQYSGNNPFSPKQLMGLLVVPFVAVAAQWFLRHELAPVRPGVGRALAVGGLTVVIAALLASASVWGLANGLGEPALARQRTELLEITKVQQNIRPKEKRNAAFEKQELQRVAELSVFDLARGTFTWTVMLGLLLAIPGGLFFRK